MWFLEHATTNDQKCVSWPLLFDKGCIQASGGEDVGASVDGMWQRKGFLSTLGVVTAISIDDGKVLDVAIFSKSCKGCTSMKNIASSDPARYETWKLSIIVILVIPALLLEWKQQELLRFSVYQKRNMDYVTLLFMEMVTATQILLAKICMVQVNLLRSLTVSVNIKNVSFRGFVVWKKIQKELEERENSPILK